MLNNFVRQFLQIPETIFGCDVENPIVYEKG